jgi:hypothetical protein
MIKKTAEFDAELVKQYDLILTASEDMRKTDKIKESVKLLSQACDLIEECDQKTCKKACKKIKKVIGRLGKLADECVAEITPSEDAEKEVQETIENQ